jgi:ligand-binding sensor protein
MNRLKNFCDKPGGTAASSRSRRVARLRCEAGRSAGCTVLAVVRQRASGTVITGTVPARRKRSSCGS